MSTRKPNPRLAKIHRSYSVEEVARLYGTHRNTVRAWIRAGLPTIDGSRPILIAGRDLGGFLRARRQRNARPCGAGELYCCRCRTPQKPAGNRAVYEPMNATTGNLVGICSTCSAWMNRRVSLANLGAVLGDVAVSLPEAQERIGESHPPSVNCAFK
ncbi:helix-turn-helix domain-containing protein [Dyella sp. S184]|uniref:helix-turn-helix domain-containing protein n=1 Tax=Dyella sp. S184 TaxID=1641862 RepID=UPI00131D835E|nr:helix-turn-helix domain-containing protein [Dyella sp. S184]